MSHGREAGALILVVDDVPDNLELMSHLLAGYRLKVSNNGEGAVRLALAQPQPDLIMLDLMMPGIDGMRFAEG